MRRLAMRAQITIDTGRAMRARVTIGALVCARRCVLHHAYELRCVMPHCLYYGVASR